VRILLDPAAEPGQPPATPPPAPAPPAAPPTAAVSLSPEEYRALLEKSATLDRVQAEKSRAESEREAARLEKLAADGKSKEALDALRTAKDAEVASERTRASALEGEILGGRLDSAITTGIAGAEFVSPAAAAIARKELAGRLESVRDAAGNVVVREVGTHRPATEAIASWLASDDAAFFRKAGTLPGPGAKGGSQPTPTPTPAGDDGKPLSFTEANLLLAKEARNAPGTAYGLTYRAPVK
jgi:hypothetical protein